MFKNWVVICIAALVAVVGAYAYFHYRTAPGTVPMGDSTETVAWLGLATAIIGLLTSVIGLIQKLLDK